jgi:uncharacterized membrane protein YhaH (DUF805 family)
MSFNGLIDRSDFAVALARRNLWLLAATFSWPFILAALVVLTDCKGTGGACGALRLMLSLLVKPLIYIIFTAAILPIFLKRCRDIGVSGWTVLPVLVILSSGLGFWTGASAPWTVSFSLGITDGVTPVIVAGFAILVFMCFPLAFARPRTFEGFIFALSLAVLLPLALQQFMNNAIIATPEALGNLTTSLIWRAIFCLAAFGSLMLEAAPFALTVMALEVWKKTSALKEPSIKEAMVYFLGLVVVLTSTFCLVVSLSRSTGLITEAMFPLSSALQVANYARFVELLALLVLPLVISSYYRGKDGFVETAKAPALNGPRQRGELGPRSDLLARRRTGFGRR